MTSWIIIVLISLTLSALFSAVETAFVTGDRVRVEIDAKRGGVIGRILNKFYGDGEFFISSLLVANNIVNIIYGMGAVALLTPWLKTLFPDNEAAVLVTQTLVSTIVVLMAGEFLPKTVSRINPNSSLKFFALPVYFFYLLLYPVSLFVSWVSRGLMRLFGLESHEAGLGMLSVRDLNDYLEETIDNLAEKKEHVEHEVKIFQNALDFSSTHLRDCMLPRNEIVAVNIDTVTRDELSELFTSTGRSKIVVYRDDIDNILGYIHVSELFDPESDWHEHIIPVLYGPETLLADKMMRRLLNEKRSMAIVIDEFGGTAGLVTLEDLVEEIFGDFEDEHDKDRLSAVEVAPDTYEIAARCDVAWLNDRFHLDIPEEDDYQTVAGYVLHETGTIPDQGASVTIGNLTFTVLKKSRNRLEHLRVTRHHEPEAE